MKKTAPLRVFRILRTDNWSRIAIRRCGGARLRRALYVSKRTAQKYFRVIDSPSRQLIANVAAAGLRHSRAPLKDAHYVRLAALICGLMLSANSPAQEIDVSRYAWEFPVVTNIRGAEDLVQELREEVQAILDAGHLAPLNCRYGDLMPSPAESHFVYQEPGRIITTLAWAYPHLDAQQQQSVRRYVAAELEDRRFAPWAEQPMPRDVGARREWHPMERVWGAEVKFGQNRPSVHTLYGLWLYAFMSGDWALVRSKWPEMRAAYERRAREGVLYGTMGAHVGMARLAEKFQDAETRTNALAHLQLTLHSGTDFAGVENFCRSNYYREHYTPRNANGRALYHGAMFLNISPEM